ncbi:uncharacterized protein LOC134387332 [Cynocephalus volans]|uniref:uncharacterized protein LOC134387332 n=1 Tax=Cynocephalus volans TaxID=110931 RepID=UPI002FC7232B
MSSHPGLVGSYSNVQDLYQGPVMGLLQARLGLGYSVQHQRNLTGNGVGGTQRPLKENIAGPLAEDKGGTKTNAEPVSPSQSDAPAATRPAQLLRLAVGRCPPESPGERAVVQASCKLLPRDLEKRTEGHREPLSSPARDNAGSGARERRGPKPPSAQTREAACEVCSLQNCRCLPWPTEAGGPWSWTSRRPPPRLTSQDQEVPVGNCRAPRRCQPSPDPGRCSAPAQPTASASISQQPLRLLLPLADSGTGAWRPPGGSWARADAGLGVSGGPGQVESARRERVPAPSLAGLVFLLNCTSRDCAGCQKCQGDPSLVHGLLQHFLFYIVFQLPFPRRDQRVTAEKFPSRRKYSPTSGLPVSIGYKFPNMDYHQNHMEELLNQKESTVFFSLKTVFLLYYLSSWILKFPLFKRAALDELESPSSSLRILEKRVSWMTLALISPR